MGKELEFKLAVPNTAVLDQIVIDCEVNALAEGIWLETKMKTTYYDSLDQRFAARHWTLRHRMEGEKSVICVKTPTNVAHTRGEWEIVAPEINDAAVEQLLLAGAPMELLQLYGIGDVVPICGAEFTRRSVMLKFSDGSRGELAADIGRLYGSKEEMPFLEVELELYEGKAEAMELFVQTLAERYGLKEQRMSKHARARSLK